MVRLSLREPALTFEVNVLGTVNVLEAVRLAGESVRAVVVVTSDKCYANPPGSPRRLTEDDPLGGKDPYSASKACAELVTAAYRESFSGEALRGGRERPRGQRDRWGRLRRRPAGSGHPARLRRRPAGPSAQSRRDSPVAARAQSALRLSRARAGTVRSGGDKAARAFNFGPRPRTRDGAGHRAPSRRPAGRSEIPFDLRSVDRWCAGLRAGPRGQSARGIPTGARFHGGRTAAGLAAALGPRRGARAGRRLARVAPARSRTCARPAWPRSRNSWICRTLLAPSPKTVVYRL